jgi:hypothetical protein
MTSGVKWFLAIAGIFALAVAFEKSPKFGSLLVLLTVGGMLIVAQKKGHL